MAGTVNWGTATVIAMFAGMLYGGSKEASASVVSIKRFNYIIYSLGYCESLYPTELWFSPLQILELRQKFLVVKFGGGNCQGDSHGVIKITKKEKNEESSLYLPCIDLIQFNILFKMPGCEYVRQ